MGKLSVYDASAGSGKTYTLVYKYLCILFTPSLSTGKPQREIFKKILAITFTNKAAWEMKSRILSTLQSFSHAVDIKSHDMLPSLVEETGLSFPQIKSYASQILSDIYADYSSFTVCTIDSFTTRLVRSFSRELHLPSSFSIAVDSADILSESVDMLLLKAGRDNKSLTSILVDFVSDKIDEGKQWDITSTLNKNGEIWKEENNMIPLSRLSECRIEDFLELKKRLTEYINGVRERLSEKGKEALDIIRKEGIKKESITGGKNGVFTVLSKAACGDMTVNIYNRNVSSFIDGKYSSAKASAEDKAALERCADDIVLILNDIIEIVESESEGYKNAVMILKPLKRLSVAYSIKKEMDTIKDRNNIMLLREFNEIISKHLREEPVPFIYEKLGERYQHYFIDEFQDTSLMQWENMKNLIYNALSGDGSAMIVGDGKQAIYRFRGGDSELFLDLCEKKSDPLPSSQVELVRLFTNYRSSGVLVNFANDFFKTAQEYLPQKDDKKDFTSTLNESLSRIFRYAKMYIDGNNQKYKKEHPGYVSIQKVEGENSAEIKEQYLSSTLREIRRIVDEDGFSYSDIAILYRYNSEGASLAEYLSSHSIPVVTTESLLIKESVMVEAVIFLMKFLLSPDDKYARVSILNYLYRNDRLMGYADVTSYYHKVLTLSSGDFIKELSLHIPTLDITSLFSLPLYECVESIIDGMDMWKKGQDAYLLGLLDMVHRFIGENTATLSSFLEYWDSKKDKESISSPSASDAVKMLTLHRSKGLEYPVVIFPFAVWDIRKTEEVWIDTPPDDKYALLPTVPIYLKDVERLNPSLYEEHISKIRLDNLNTYYVALTRASRQLHIIMDKGSTRENMSILVNNFLSKNTIYHDDDTDGIYLYSRGSRGKHDYKHSERQKEKDFGSITYIPWKTRLKISPMWKKMWMDMEGDNPVVYGNSLHDVLSMINTSSDVDIAVGRAVKSGIIHSDMEESVAAICRYMVNNPLLADYYSDKYTILTERDVVSPDGGVRRPDRVCIKGDSVVIIDYKTGAEKSSHSHQVDEYGELLSSMGYKVEKKLLVYIREDGIECVEV